MTMTLSFLAGKVSMEKMNAFLFGPLQVVLRYTRALAEGRLSVVYGRGSLTVYPVMISSQ